MNIAIIVKKITPRLTYTLDWIFTQQLGLDYKLYTQKKDVQKSLLIIDYTNDNTDFSIPNFGLLDFEGISEQEIKIGHWNDLPCLFANEQSDGMCSFDLFSAVFYLISRYEEYLPFTPDKHNRYPATDSILFKRGLLERPIIDEWLFAFANLLRTNGISIRERCFEFLPTYDIDIAWSYKNKGLKRTLGGLFKSLAQSNFDAVYERIAVLRGNKQDPYFSFDSTNALHANYSLKPLYFVLTAAENGPFDKHVLPSNRQMKVLIQDLAKQYKIGMHPSYDANARPSLFADEQRKLATLTRQHIDISRQHYIKIEWPNTYRSLIQLGIRQDYSMGYGTHLGFRAGTSRPFFWYDLQPEQQTQLQIFPFCFMDTTAHYELKLSAKEAFKKLNCFMEILRKTNGLLVTVFHNFSLGTDKEWKDWAEAYADFFKK
jgi:hypothetical protein